MKTKLDSDIEKEHLRACMDVLNMLEGFCRNLDEKVDKEQQEVKACKKNNEMEQRLIQELHLHHELNDRHDKLIEHGSELDKVCSNFESHVNITENDQNRLDAAKESYEVAKELTGVRLDFSAPPNVAKGYVKSKTRRLLQPFEMAAIDNQSIWALVQNTAGTGWPNSPNDENTPEN